MQKIKYIYFLIFVLITAAAYIIIFGSVGLIVQGQLDDNLRALQDDVGSLEKENEILNERYIQLLESARSAVKKVQKEEVVIILKFRNIKKEHSRNNQIESRENNNGLNLLEARILFLSTMVFIGLLGYAALNKWKR